MHTTLSQLIMDIQFFLLLKIFNLENASANNCFKVGTINWPSWFFHL